MIKKCVVCEQEFSTNRRTLTCCEKCKEIYQKRAKKTKKYKTKKQTSHCQQITVYDTITVHFLDPKEKILCEYYAKLEGCNSASEWLRQLWLTEIKPKREKKFKEGKAL